VRRNKSPGPDGYNFGFLKTCWETLREDILNFLHEFHGNAILPKAITASFLALIPKSDSPQELNDYIPICLIGSLYKIVAKLLAKRIKKVIGKLISDCQTAFVPGRQILDGVLVINELIDLAKRKRKECLLLKVDFEKAYDFVNWKYLKYMLKRMGFGQRWLAWMEACVFISSMSVLVNGSPTEDFQVGRGLRQGDPLSPFLFLIAAEGLTGLARNAVDLGEFKEFKVAENVNFTFYNLQMTQYLWVKVHGKTYGALNPFCVALNWSHDYALISSRASCMVSIWRKDLCRQLHPFCLVALTQCLLSF